MEYWLASLGLVAALAAATVASVKPTYTTTALAFIVLTTMIGSLPYMKTTVVTGYNETVVDANTTTVTYKLEQRDPPVFVAWAVWGMWVYTLILMVATVLTHVASTLLRQSRSPDAWR